MEEESSSPHASLVEGGSGDQGPLNLSSVSAATALHAKRAVAFEALAPALADPWSEERELVRAVRAREANAGDRLYDLLVGTMDRAVARTLGPGQPEHDDLVQASFEQLIVSLASGRFRHECSLRSFAGSIASHLALNAIRSRRRERAVFARGRELDEDEVPTSARTERDLDSKRRLERLRVELGAMSQERAHALVLHQVLGHDLKEVAAMLGISVAAAQSRVVRARRELEERLQQALGGDDG